MTEPTTANTPDASPRRRIWLILASAVGVAAVLVVTLVLAGVGPFARGRLNAYGRISLTTEHLNSTTCQGDDIWADIHDGTTITVKDGSGDTLGTTTLGPGRPGPTGRGCTFEFVVSVPTGSGTYRFAVGDHDVLGDFTEDELLRLEVGIADAVGELTAAPSGSHP